MLLQEGRNAKIMLNPKMTELKRDLIRTEKFKAIREGKSTTFRTIEEFFHCCNEKDE